MLNDFYAIVSYLRIEVLRKTVYACLKTHDSKNFDLILIANT